MLAGFNLGADATTLPMPASGDRWERVLDGEHLDLAAPVPDGGLPLPAYGFALCVPAGSAEDGGRVEAAR
jgi:hypothetical protein